MLLSFSRSVMSDSVQPHRRQPTRLLHLWDSPGKNTGVGCHFLLQCMKVKSESEVAQSCLTLCDPRDCSLPSSSIHEIFQSRVLEWVAVSWESSKAEKRWQRICPTSLPGSWNPSVLNSSLNPSISPWEGP